MVKRLIVGVLFLCATVFSTGNDTVYASKTEDFDLGLKAARQGDFDRAVQFWSRTLQRRPKSYAAFVNRGSAYLLSGHVMKGIRDWKQAKRYSPVFAYAVYTGEFIDRAGGDRRLLNFAKPLELDPKYVASVLMMGAAYLDLGRTREASELYEISIELTRNPVLKNRFDHWKSSLDDTDG